MSTEHDLARNFGFDITMSDSNMGLPTAVHKEYLERCHFLYKEFMANMNIHMKHEKVLRKELRSLQKEKMQHLQFSLYRSASDPFARHTLHSSSSMQLDSRCNTPWGLSTIPDEEDQVFRPQTAPAGARRNTDINSNRPKSAVVDTVQAKLDDDEQSDTDLSDVSGVSKSTIVGVLDKSTERGSSRKIIVGQQSFNKIAHGEVRVKIRHKDGRFLVRPVRTDGRADFDSETSNADTQAYEPDLCKQQFDPLYERLALVRKLTNFKSPTISSDMKINNRVPIQKSLKGIDAKRTTVSEIYQNARDRKSRHFRIVSSKPRSKSAMSRKENVTSLVQSFLSSIRTKSALPNKALNSQLSSRQGDSRDPTQALRGQRNSSHRDEINSIASVNRDRPRSILHSSSSGTNSANNSGTKVQGDSCNANDVANSAFTGLFRSQSKVAFARSDSQAGGDNVNLSASFSGSVGSVRQFGDNLNVPERHPGRHIQLSLSSSSDVNSKCPRVETKTRSEYSVSTPDNSPRSRHGASPTEQRVFRTDSRSGLIDTRSTCADLMSELSMSSAGTATSFIAKLKLATTSNKTKTVAGSVQKLGFHAPNKMDSRNATAHIVRQQIRQDKQLDEIMTVWRRRMAVRSSSSTSPRSASGRRGGRL